MNRSCRYVAQYLYKKYLPPLFSNAMQRHNLTVKSPHHPSCQISIPNFFRYFFFCYVVPLLFDSNVVIRIQKWLFFHSASFIQAYFIKKSFYVILKKYCWSTSLIRRNTSVDQGVWWVGRGCPKDKFVCRGSASIFANFTILLN